MNEDRCRYGPTMDGAGGICGARRDHPVHNDLDYDSAIMGRYHIFREKFDPEDEGSEDSP